MVPPAPTATRRRICFPRASGDGPDACQGGVEMNMFPPRERGWSLRHCWQGQHGTVSPARAGMVPQNVVMLHGCHGFPRASGDGPSNPAMCGAEWWFPPRERGWSRWRADSGGVFHVSPARAGMVPPDSRRAPCDEGFPRASGDGPPAFRDIYLMQLFPPRERGWSHVIEPMSTGKTVSPARAGMVPVQQSGAGLRPRFPRASGDGPDC